MPKIIEGKMDASGLRIGLLVSRFNSFVCDRLVEGAIDGLLRHGAAKEDLSVVRVPGA
ncbi:MAG: 6,7-dimethyl-8-ribityllumazine synthase, partial [Desulfuromonadales bacterium]|nr:6,7-dimethyl-8-ribityllumazine synthase [Desulfuromonadales bacterium]